MEHIIKILRVLFFQIDKVIYTGLGMVYSLLLKISRTTIFSEDVIKAVSERIYVFIGIFMLFKISISLINYIVNPDQFVDKDRGFANIIKRVVISLVLLVLVPYVFKEAYALQTMILENNTIFSIVFATSTDNADKINKADSAGEKMKFILMYTFFQPNYNELSMKSTEGSNGTTGDLGISSCAVTYEYNDDGSIKKEDDYYVLNPECFGTYSGNEYSGGAFQELWSDSEDAFFQTYAIGVSRQNYSLTFRKSTAIATVETKDGEEVYLIDYSYILSTVVGVAVIWILLMFCIDIAIRSVKLGFYQLIAPIPILSYISPNNKDGMFEKWVKQCVNTYLSLFMRLAALYIGLFIIFEVSSKGITDVVTGEQVTDWGALIFIIIGVLMFAKQLPKILEDTLGFKGTGDFTLNPVKKLEEGMIGGKTLAKPLKAVGAIGKGAALGATVGVGTALGVGAAGLITGQGLRGGAMGKAIMGAAKGEKFGKNFASSYGAGRSRKKELDKMKADGVTPGQVRKEKMYNAFHGETHAEKVASLEAQGKAIQSYYETIKSQAIACDSAATYTRFNPTTGATEYVKSAKTLSKELEEIKKTQIDRTAFHDYVDGSGRTITASEQYNQAVQDQMRAVQDKEKELENRINDLAQGRVTTGEASADQIIASATKSMQALVKQSNELGKSLSDSFVEIPQNLADNKDVVAMFKKSKGTVAQTTAGDLSTIKDVGKYADGGGKK